MIARVSDLLMAETICLLGRFDLPNASQCLDRERTLRDFGYFFHCQVRGNEFTNRNLNAIVCMQYVLAPYSTQPTKLPSPTSDDIFVFLINA